MYRFVTAFVFVVLCYGASSKCFAQQELRASAISLVPPAHAAIETATEFNERIYAVHTGGGLMSYSQTLGDAQRVEFFRGKAVSKVYVYDAVMFVVTFDGEYYSTTNGIDYTALNVQARLECRMPDMQPYIWTSTGLVTVSVSSGSVNVVPVSSISCPPTVTSFVVVGDTILAKPLSTSNSASENEIKRWHVSGDTLPTLIPDSLPQDGYSQLVILSNGWLGAIRYFDVFVSDPREGAGSKWSAIPDPLIMIRPLRIRRLHPATLPLSRTVIEWDNPTNQAPEFYWYVNNSSTVERVNTPSIAPITYPSCIVHLGDALVVGASENNIVVAPDSIYRQPLQTPVINKTLNLSGHFTNGRPVLLTPLSTPPPVNTTVVAGFTDAGVLYPFGPRQSDIVVSRVLDVIHESNRVFLLTGAGMLKYYVQFDSLRQLTEAGLNLSSNEAAAIVYDDTLILISPRRIRVSTNGGDDWLVRIAPRLFRGAQTAFKVGDYIVAQGVDGIATMSIQDILEEDTVDATMWYPRNGLTMCLAGSVGSRATIVIGHPRGNIQPNFHIDTFTVYALDPATARRDSVNVVLGQPVFSNFTAFWLQDTLRIVNMAAGRHIDVVGSNVVRDVYYTHSPLLATGYYGDVRILPDSSGYIVFYRGYATAEIVQLFPADTTTSVDNGHIDYMVNEMYAEMYIEGVSPNPSRDQFNVVIGRHPQADPGSAQLRLHDINGNLVTDLSTMLDPQQTHGTKHTVEVISKDLPAGTYLITIENRGRKDVKIVKIVR